MEIDYPQASFLSITQQQAELSRPKAEFITAAAQPTPASTLKAAGGQFWAQAPHSMQASRFSIRALPLSSKITAWGHTTVHVPHPTHFSWSKAKVTTSLR
jgi:hypothetical protein